MRFFINRESDHIQCSVTHVLTREYNLKNLFLPVRVVLQHPWEWVIDTPQGGQAYLTIPLLLDF